MGKLLPNLLVVCVLCASPDPPACVNDHWGEHEWAPPSKVAGRKVRLFVCTFVCTVHRAVNHLQLLICVFFCHALIHKWKTWTIPPWCLYCCWTHNCAGCSKSEFTMSLSFILQPNPQFRCWSHSRTVTERMEKDGKSVYISSCLPHNALYSPSSFHLSKQPQNP